MARCGSCDGIIGVDCFNPQDCAWISHQQETQSQRQGDQRISELEAEIARLRSSGGPVMDTQQNPCRLRWLLRHWLDYYSNSRRLGNWFVESANSIMVSDDEIVARIDGWMAEERTREKSNGRR